LIATADELLARLAGPGAPPPKNANVAILTDLLQEHQVIVEQYTGRRFSPNPPLDSANGDTAPDVAVTINVQRRKVIPLPDARVVTSVALGGATLLSTSSYRDYELLSNDGVFTDLVLYPDQPNRFPLAHYSGWNTITVTGRFGIWPVPADIKGALLLMCARAYKEQEARFGDVVNLGDGGSVAYYKTLPPRAKMTLDRYALQVTG